jgi:hypothetical protein
MTNFEDMSDEEFTELLVPNGRDLQRASAWLVQQERLDPKGMLGLYLDAVEEGRIFQLLVCLGESLTRAMGLREDPEALQLLHEDITHRATEGDN